MISTNHYYIVAALVLCQSPAKVAAQQCGSQYSIFGMMLRGHTFKTLNTSISFECNRACNDDIRCHSFNYIFKNKVCELNNRTKEARPENFVPDKNRYYFRRNKEMVPLGSIPELPAETCKEIKTSEGGQAVSGKYWFDSIVPGKVVHAHCNMETDDVDECSSSIPVCAINATCQNTNSSYVCVCEAGFGGRNCTDIDECSGGQVCDVNADCQNTYGSYVCSCKDGFYGDGDSCVHLSSISNTCNEVLQRNSAASDGTYKLTTSQFSAYCDMTSPSKGWTLIARFANSDDKNWMDDTGNWWYDKDVAYGETTDPSINTDMISPAFWLASGSEFKITRSDDSQHTPLLQTTDNCLGGQTFRSTITSYGDFRNGTIWASNECLESCDVQYGGQYQTTDGFIRATCSGDIQSSNEIGFWCDWDSGDGAVLMIGGGGSSCGRADHGIGVTEANEASFVYSGSAEIDFGSDGGSGATEYSLNLWVL